MAGDFLGSMAQSSWHHHGETYRALLPRLVPAVDGPPYEVEAPVPQPRPQGAHADGETILPAFDVRPREDGGGVPPDVGAVACEC